MNPKNPRILIMAQGEGKRWHGGQHKCLAEIAGEPLVTRLICQLRVLDHPNITVIAEEDEFASHVDVPIFEVPTPSPEVCHGIRDTAHLWEGAERIVILLGDTVYSWKALATILDDTAPLRVFGRLKPNPCTLKAHSERYALAFDVEMGVAVLALCERAIAQEGYPPALKAFYYALIGAPLDPYGGEIYYDNRYLCVIDDYTDDIDDLSEYEHVKDRLEAAIEAEERVLEKEP